jgi:hypothetical protein
MLFVQNTTSLLVSLKGEKLEYHLHLPLGVLAVQEALEDSNDLLQGGEVDAQLLLNLGLIGTKLGIEVLAVRASTHGGAEDGLDEEAVVGLQGGAVCGAERVGKLFGAGRDVLAEGNAGELEATMCGQ